MIHNTLGKITKGYHNTHILFLLFILILTSGIIWGFSSKVDTGGDNYLDSLVTLDMPKVSAVSPNVADAGTIVVVKGSDFHKATSLDTILLAGKKISPISASSTELSFVLPFGIKPGIYSIVVSAKGRRSESKPDLSFQVKTLNDSIKEKILNFNYSIGTQTFKPSYTFSSQTGLVETAEAIHKMGSNIIKIDLDPSLVNYPDISGSYRSFTALVRNNHSFKKVLNMPFTYYFLWTNSIKWTKDNGYGVADRKADSTELSNLTIYLLNKYNNTGKEFFLGHWEGDWWLLGGYDPNVDVPEERIEAMIQWYNSRQRAVDYAKRVTPHHNVKVYTYAEVNRVVDAMEGKPRITNKILPYSKVDFVSYSSYDAQDMSFRNYEQVLNYIQKHLSPKPQIQGKRVFVGEFAKPAIQFEHSENGRLAHEAANRKIIRKSLKWGTPFVLYWEMYNNDVKDGIQQGFWLIDNKNAQWPLYKTYQRFYVKAKTWLAIQIKTHHKLPSREKYMSWAYGALANPLY